MSRRCINVLGGCVVAVLYSLPALGNDLGRVVIIDKQQETYK